MVVIVSNEDLHALLLSIDSKLTVLMDKANEEIEDPNPWPFKLIQEFTSATDQDDNGMIYGVDFIFEENIENHPPAMHGIAIDLRNHWRGKVITWEDYVNSLAGGTFKNNVQAYVSRLNPKVNNTT